MKRPYFKSIYHKQHYKRNHHSSDTASHNLNNNIATGFNQEQRPARLITVVIDISKAFSTVNIQNSLTGSYTPSLS